MMGEGEIGLLIKKNNLTFGEVDFYSLKPEIALELLPLLHFI